MIGFVCEGCGIQVYDCGIEQPPHQLCQMCRWLCEHFPADEIMDARRRVEPGGWISERVQRHQRDIR